MTFRGYGARAGHVRGEMIVITFTNQDIEEATRELDRSHQMSGSSDLKSIRPDFKSNSSRSALLCCESVSLEV